MQEAGLRISQDYGSIYLWETVKGAVGELGSGFFEVVMVSGASPFAGLGVRFGVMCEVFEGGDGRRGMRVLGGSTSTIQPASTIQHITTQPNPHILVVKRTQEGKYIDSWAWELKPHEETSGTHYALHPRTLKDGKVIHKAAPKVNTVPQTITAAIESTHLTHLTGIDGTLKYTSETGTETFDKTNLHLLPTRLLNRKAGDVISVKGETWATEGGIFQGTHKLFGHNSELERRIHQAALDALTSSATPQPTPSDVDWVRNLITKTTDDTQVIINALNHTNKTIDSTAVTFYQGQPMIEHPGLIKMLRKEPNDVTIIIQRFDDAPTAENPGSIYGLTPDKKKLDALECASILQSVGLT